MVNRSVGGMESKKEDSRVAQFGDLISPVVVGASLLLLFIVASALEGRDLDNEINSVILVALSVLVPACIGRCSRLIPLRTALYGLGPFTCSSCSRGRPTISTQNPSITCSLLPFS